MGFWALPEARGGDVVTEALSTVARWAFAELGLGDPDLSDAQLLDAMVAHPILINRPVVFTPLGVRLCRPSETVLDILPAPQRADFTKEDGEVVPARRG